MKRFLSYVLPLAALGLVVGAFDVLAGVTPSSMTSLRSPTPVMNGPVLSGRLLNIGEVSATDPRTGAGLQRPVGSFLYTQAGTVAYVKTGSAATAWELFAGGSIAGTSASFWTARAAALTGITPASGFTCRRDDFENVPASPIYTVTNIGSGTEAVSPTTTIVGNWADVNSGATAASTGILTTGSTPFGRLDTQRFYLASRFAVTTAIDNQTIAVVTLGSAGFGPNVGVGICGATSTALFEVFYDGALTQCAGTKASTGVAFATNGKHTFEMWGTGDGKIHFSADLVEIAGSPFTQAAAPTVSQRAGIVVSNGTTAAARTLEIDWWQSCWSET